MTKRSQEEKSKRDLMIQAHAERARSRSRREWRVVRAVYCEYVQGSEDEWTRVREMGPFML
jgi:hypothetical protein